MSKRTKPTEAEKAIIIEHVKTNGYSNVRNLFGVWPDTIKYWIDPDFKVTAKTRSASNSKTADQLQRMREYAAANKEDAKANSARWKEKQDPQSIRDKQAAHRAANREHYAEVARASRERAKAKKLEEASNGTLP